MPTKLAQPRKAPTEANIQLRKQDLVELREICDTLYSLYELLRDREDSVAIACLLRPNVRAFSRFVELLEDRLLGETERAGSLRSGPR